jgi:hypothetical protein
MANYKLKTQATDSSVMEFLNTLEDENRLKDALKIVEMMAGVSGENPKMWGPSIIGFGHYHYKYNSGHEGDMCKIGFSPRKDAFAFYIYFDKDQKQSLLLKLGKHKAAKSCFYVKKLSDVDEEILKEIFEMGYKHFNMEY